METPDILAQITAVHARLDELAVAVQQLAAAAQTANLDSDYYSRQAVRELADLKRAVRELPGLLAARPVRAA